MRATQTTTYRSLGFFLDRTSTRMADLQKQIATGKRMVNPSDDPTAISPLMAANTQIKNAERYTKTINSGLDRINNSEGHMDTINNVMIRMREIAISAGDSGYTDADLHTFANEVSQLREQLIDVGNAQVDGKYLFAGFADKTKPFTWDALTRTVSYAGDQGSVQYEISPGETIEVNTTGSALMQGDLDNDGVTDPGQFDIFALMTTIEDALLANNPTAVVSEIDNLVTANDQVLTLRSLKGNTAARLENGLLSMSQIEIDMREMKSRFEDADLLETITSLTQQESAFEAALNMTGKISRISILDFL